MLKIWSLRNSGARGNHWKYERDSTEENIQEWLKIFRNDEPGVIFVGSKCKPPIRK